MSLNTLDFREKCPYCTVDEYYGLKALGNSMPEGVCVVMIGAGPGQLLMSWLEGYKYNKANITVIDIDTCQWVGKHIAGNPSITTKNLITYVVTDSAAFGRMWNTPVDLLIVDGDHTKEGVLRDIAAWRDKVTMGGLVWFHDYNPSVWGTPTGVKEAIEESKLDWTPVLTCGCSILYKRES